MLVLKLFKKLQRSLPKNLDYINFSYGFYKISFTFLQMSIFYELFPTFFQKFVTSIFDINETFTLAIFSYCCEKNAGS
jgi:hypothetical protein